MLRTFIVAALCLGLLSTSFGQDTQTFSLQDAVNYSYEHHTNMRLAENKIRTSEQEMIEVRAMGIPQVNAGVDYNYNIKLPTTLIPDQFFNPMAGEDDFSEVSFGTTNNLVASATLRTLLFDGTYLTALKASKAVAEFANLEYQHDKAQLRDAVKKAYLPPLLMLENIKTVEENIRVLEKMHFETNAMYEEGFVEKLDVDKLELSLDNMKVTLEDLRKSYKTAVDALKVQIGFPLEQELELIESVEAMAAPLADFNEDAVIDYMQRTEFRMLEQNKVLQQLNIERYQKGYWPSLSGFVTYQQQVQGNNLFDNPSNTGASFAGLSLNVPIFDGFSKKALKAQARIGYENVIHTQEMLKSSIDLQVKIAHRNYKNALENIDSRKRNVDLAERIFEISQIKYREGMGSSLEIIQAEQSLFQSQQNYIQSLYDFILAKIDLEIAYGKE
ncbi:MAG: TolC family protein [Bacteroidetes bacterium]|nr:MAG: TolC family protein [Bacteroidota bacterium]